jgi:excisionase family DNA binding protein
VELNQLWYSIDSAAVHLGGVSKAVIQRDVRRGLIRSVRYGRRILIPRDEILRIARDGMQPVTQVGAAHSA